MFLRAVVAYLACLALDLRVTFSFAIEALLQPEMSLISLVLGCLALPVRTHISILLTSSTQENSAMIKAAGLLSDCLVSQLIHPTSAVAINDLFSYRMLILFSSNLI